MVIPGMGVGDGVGTSWASAADDIAATASTMASATARTTLRPTPVPSASEGRDAQRMNSNPTGPSTPATPDSLPSASICPQLAGSVNCRGTPSGLE